MTSKQGEVRGQSARAPGWIPGVRKIAALRANALGDFLFTLPALEALRAAYPQAEITLLGKAWHAEFLNGRPGPVDRVMVVPRYRGVGEEETWEGPTPEEEQAVERFFRQARMEQFDLALQMHGGGRYSNPFVLGMGARLTAGLRADDAAPLDRWVRYEYWQSEVLRLLEVAGLAGAPLVTVEPRLVVTDRDRQEADSSVELPANLPLVVIHPGSSDPRRRWPAEKFAAVGDALSRAGCAVAVIGVPAESQAVGDVLSAMTQPANNLCGRLTLHALTGLLERAALVVANDSGPRHLAAAVQAPTVGIYWCGNLINACPAFRARQRVHLSWRLNCPVCGQNTIHNPCRHQESFVDEVTVEEVLSSAWDLLGVKESR